MFDWAYLIPLAPFIMVLGIVWMKNHQKLEEKAHRCSRCREC